MRKSCDVVIVGAGAAGNAVAKRLENVCTIVVDKKSDFSRPAECAGLVSVKSLELLDMKKNEIIQNEIYGAFIHSPKGKTYHIGGDRLHAYAIDRKKLDEEMAKIAMDRGVEYILGVKINDISKEGGRIVVKGEGGEKIEAEMLIGADGIDSVVREKLFGNRPDEILFGINVDVENVEFDPKNVHVFFGKNLTPDFFAWIIPTTPKGDKARVGICVSYPPVKSPKNLLHDLFNYPTTKPFLEGAEIINIVAGRIPLGYIKESVKDNAMLIGDAAFQVKPLSGGGIYPIAVSSQICVDVVSKSFEERRFEENFLKMYHEKWSEKLKKEIILGMWLRRKFKIMKDDDIEFFLSHIDGEVLEVINRYGDIDHPSKLILPLTKKLPKLVSLLPRFLTLF